MLFTFKKLISLTFFRSSPVLNCSTVFRSWITQGKGQRCRAWSSRGEWERRVQQHRPGGSSPDQEASGQQKGNSGTMTD